MITTTQIEQTETYQKIVTRDKFMERILLGKKSKDSINHIVDLINMHGKEYIKDKNFSTREVNIALEIVG